MLYRFVFIICDNNLPITGFCVSNLALSLNATSIGFGFVIIVEYFVSNALLIPALLHSMQYHQQHHLLQNLLLLNFPDD